MPPSSVENPDGETPRPPETPLTPILDVVVCDGADASPIVVAAHSLRAEVRLLNSPDAWLEQLARAEADGRSEPADVAAFIGAASRLTAQRWVARAALAAPETVVLAAIYDASLDHASTVVNQGARGLIVLPNSAERVAHHLREALTAALHCQPSRRAMAKHRRALASLTVAEKEVLDAMLAGMPNKKIAQRLGIGLRTVELRRSKIMRKMHTKSLAQLISFVTAVQPHGC